MRTETEMQITLARLRDEFSVDVAPALGLHGPELAAWLEVAEDVLFYDLMGSGAAKKSAIPAHFSPQKKLFTPEQEAAIKAELEIPRDVLKAMGNEAK